MVKRLKSLLFFTAKLQDVEEGKLCPYAIC